MPVRCVICNKKVPLHLQSTPCKCGGAFCSLHRLPESHFCVHYYHDDGSRVFIETPLKESEQPKPQKVIKV